MQRPIDQALETLEQEHWAIVTGVMVARHGYGRDVTEWHQENEPDCIACSLFALLEAQKAEGDSPAWEALMIDKLAQHIGLTPSRMTENISKKVLTLSLIGCIFISRRTKEMTKQVVVIDGAYGSVEVNGFETMLSDGYVVGFDLRQAGKADEIYTAINKAVAEKTTITLVFGEDKVSDGKVEAHQELMAKRMTWD